MARTTRASCPGGDRRIPRRPGGHRDHLALSVAGSDTRPGDQCAENPGGVQRSILLTRARSRAPRRRPRVHGAPSRAAGRTSKLKSWTRPRLRAILGEAERFQADVIVVGWRGHGAVRRLLMGSVSRGVVRGSKCAVLVVRRSQRVRTIVVGVDGSEAAKRALAFVGRLVPPRGRARDACQRCGVAEGSLAGPRPWRGDALRVKSDARTRFERERRRRISIARRPNSNASDGTRGPCSSTANRCAISSVLSQRVARNCSSSGRGAPAASGTCC